jgi:hypothetical protein
MANAVRRRPRLKRRTGASQSPISDRTDILGLSPDALKQLPADQLNEELNRLTPAQRKRLKPEQVAAAMESLDGAFRLTPEEQHRRDAAWRMADADSWRHITASYLPLICDSYDVASSLLRTPL